MLHPQSGAVGDMVLYKFVDISEWIGHPITLSLDLQMFAIRKYLMDFAYAIRAKEDLKTKIKIPAVNNECIRIFVPLIMTKTIPIIHLDNLYS